MISLTIRCRDIHKTYTVGDRRVHALRGVDLDLPESGYHAIMGASGSGKSTLLHLLAALDRPDRGEIIIGDTPVHALSEREATLFRRRRVGIVFQQFNLIPTLTARENVALPGLLAGEDGTRLRARSMELLDRLGVAERADHRPDALSGGEQQRVAIARALLFRPAVLLADEPTGNLDSTTSARLWSLLGEIAGEEGMTVVMVTHEPVAAAHCQTVHVMIDGRVRGMIDGRAGNGEALDAADVAARYQQLVRAG